MQVKPYTKGRFNKRLSARYQDFKNALYNTPQHTQHYPSGSLLLRQGQHLGSLFIVPSGRVSMYISTINGRRFQLGELNCCQHIFGEMEFFTGAACQWSVAAEEGITAHLVSLDELEKLLVKEPEFALFFASALAEDYLESLDIYTQRLLHSITYNVAFDLLQREQLSSGLQHFSNAAKEAERFGTTSRVYRRAIKTLIDQGLIERDGKQLRILDIAALQQFLESFD